MNAGQGADSRKPAPSEDRMCRGSRRGDVRPGIHLHRGIRPVSPPDQVGLPRGAGRPLLKRVVGYGSWPPGTARRPEGSYLATSSAVSLHSRSFRFRRVTDMPRKRVNIQRIALTFKNSPRTLLKDRQLQRYSAHRTHDPSIPQVRDPPSFDSPFPDMNYVRSRVTQSPTRPITRNEPHTPGLRRSGVQPRRRDTRLRRRGFREIAPRP